MTKTTEIKTPYNITKAYNSIITQALNSTIRDANWTVKRKGKADKKGLNTYSAGLETMSHYLTFDEWNEQTIEERATFLNDKAKEIWKI